MLFPISKQALSCPHFDSCAGCSHQLFVEPPIWREVIENFEETLNPVLHQRALTGWRCRAKLAVRGTKQNPIIGLFKKGSHEALNIPFCLVHHPRINQAVTMIQNWMERHQLNPYQEHSQAGDLRYLQFVVERASGKVQITFVLNFKDFSSPESQIWRKLLLELAQEMTNVFWHSIWVNFNPHATNTIFTDKWEKVWGEPYLWESFDGVKICFQPSNFAQANLDLFEKLLKKVKSWVREKAKVVEFFAGVGTIGLSVAAKCTWIKCEEINPHSKECFYYAKQQLSSEISQKIMFYTGSADENLNLLQGADTVIVDPPRKGLSRKFIEGLTQSSVDQLIYVSCGWDSFKKNKETLISQGWNLKKLEGYSLFPGSEHIELLTLFER
ncbi:class I SAM-dependent RNA methyltransferase [Candidatus Protochlamydia sp. R18]|uniref:class I SAM-dependent RNA methyltransferase n=1 Tax=Candidatus Protochlamydia sp. R18 TaxID=1353977 RepID=UPI0005A6F1DF|nr:class I SAM-dependent RNA methyltransferase [Candidatus Protochlamydia sp. R18]